jgi:hypothetical protein
MRVTSLFIDISLFHGKFRCIIDLVHRGGIVVCNGLQPHITPAVVRQTAHAGKGEGDGCERFSPESAIDHGP